MTNQEFVNKIDKEAENGSAYEKLIAQHIIDHFVDVSKIDDPENKSLKDCLSSIKNKAQKQAKNGVAAIEDSVVYAWAEEYFGIEHPESQPAEKPAHTEAKSSLDVDLFDLI